MDKKSNQLIHEKSPYLLQHAYNPVDWYPWGAEAFEKAKQGNRPIFLSVGYSTCHWCHVMENESFEDDEVAAILNKYYVCIKVDREERPDIDHIYMQVCQRLTGQGGWPLTVIMTPEQKPFFAGTYFPKNGKWGRPGLTDLLIKIAQEWDNSHDHILEVGHHIEKLLTEPLQQRREGKLALDILDNAYLMLKHDFDHEYGGFSEAPKFPTPHNLMFLLRYWHYTGTKDALQMVEKTLECMRAGGIFDHLGYGFSRYSVDHKWLIPHFEKMLYDNALLCLAYLETYQCTGKQFYADTAREILAYMLRDMRDPLGGFYSAEDADSEGVEGKFYIWTYAEIVSCLGEKTGQLFAAYYGVSPDGNFEEQQNVLNTIDCNRYEFARRINMDLSELDKLLTESRELLYQVREKRVHPHKDDKILTAWNALAIVALAKAAKILGDDGYKHAAIKGINFISEKLIRDDGRLLARYRNGESTYLAYLDDYVFYLWALMEAYEINFDAVYLNKAVEVAKQIQCLFWDESGQDFFFTGSDAEKLLIRPKEWYDGAIPSGNSVATVQLLRLARLVNHEELKETVTKMLQGFYKRALRSPISYCYYLIGVNSALQSEKSIVIAGKAEEKDTQDMLKLCFKGFLPEASIRLANAADRQFPLKDGKATAYICENFACQPPINDLSILADKLRVTSNIKKQS